MSDDTISGDDWDTRPSPPRAEADAHGQAALILTESLIHALIEINSLTLAQAIGVVRTAREVKVDVAHEIGESQGRMQQSLTLLEGIERSLTTEA